MINGSLNDVESIYKRTIVMINNLMTKYRLVKRIRLLDNDKHIFFQLAQGNKMIVKMINQGADIHLVFPQSKPSFEVALDSQTIIFEPPQLKEQLLRKQLSELSDKQINYTSKICRDHDFSNDFFNNQEGEIYQKDDCTTLLKEKFDTFKVPDQDQIIEILKKHLKRNQIESHNKQLIDVRFYINSEFEIVIEYKINDNQLSLHDKVKRRKWSEILYSVGHQYTFQQIDELTQSLLEQMFIVDEIQLRQQRNVIYNVIQYCPQYYQGSKEVKLHTYKQGSWKILSFLPKSFNIHKRFSRQKLIIVQNQHQLFFLDHQSLLTGDLVNLDSHLLEQYVQLIDQSQKRLELIKKQLQSANFALDQILFKEIQRVTILVKEQEILEEVEVKLLGYQEQLKQLASELDQLENEEQFFSEASKQLQDQYDLIQFQYQTQKKIYDEYKQVYEYVIGRLLNFKGTNSLSANKIELKGLYNRILLEKRRIEQHLPIYTKKTELINAIKQQQVTLLIGETGSGKSTQLVQYISEEILQRGKVICVEPRMLAARQLARRVAEEMNTRVGDGVGYLTEFGEIEDKTKIVFTQDRILLNLLLNDSSLNQYEIIIIDEAHERTMNTDILLGLMKQLLIQRKDLKLIIMSATMDEDLFGNYFNCDVYKVEGKLYPIKIKYQESFRDDYIEQIELLINRKVIEKINNRTYKQRHVLVFLAGVDEINRMLWTFQNYYKNQNIMYLGLHGSMATDEQFEVFRETNKVKIIFATRVAETALTINDVSVVIDIGVDRFIYFDQMRSMQITKVGMISQAQANQRAGRAGRTTPGLCYRLYSELDYMNMSQHKVPEMQRCNLDSVVLKLKCFKVDVLGFDFIQRPLDQALLNSIQYLKDIQALDEEEKITPLGQLMAQIQTEPRMSRILIEAFYRDVFTEVLSIISVMLNNSTLYIRNANLDTKIELLDETGDFMTFYKIYWQFKSLSQSQSYTNYAIKQYCLEKGYHYKTLRVCETTYEEIYKTFICFSEQLHLNQEVKRQILLQNNLTKEDCIMRCFLVAFYPDICVYNGNPYIGYSIVRNNKNIRIYGACALSLLNHYPKYIICTDLYSSKFDFCKVAQEVTLEQLEQVLNEKQLDSVKNYIPKSYHYKELKNIPQSFMNHLMHKFSSIYDNNQFHQYCNINKDQNIFQIWSKEEIDLEKEKKDYYETLKKYHLCKFYGQKMLVYFKYGVQVETTQVCSISELTIIQFIDCPYNVDCLRSILEQHKLFYTNIFEINANQFGYCGQIFTDTNTNAKPICDILNYECYRYFQEYQINQEQRMLFTIRPRSIQNRIVKPFAELKFYGYPNKGHGFVKFTDNKDADLFLLETRNRDFILNFQGQPQEIKKGQEAELRISGVPKNTDEKQIEMYLKQVANQLETAMPVQVRLNPECDPKFKKDWYAELTKLFEKHLDEKPFIDLRSDKQNYRITARVSGFTNVIKLEEMRKNINILYDIIGYSSVQQQSQNPQKQNNEVQQ